MTSLHKTFLAIAFCFFTSAATAAEVNIDTLTKVQWTQLDSGNFTVLTDSTGVEAEQMMVELEHFHGFMAALFGDQFKNDSKRMPLILVQDPATFKALGVPAGYGGVFVHRGSDAWIVANVEGFSPSSEKRSSSGRRTALHEVVHYFVHSIYGSVAPRWFDEGLAQYLATYLVDGDQIELGSPENMPKRIREAWLASGETDLVDAEKLFTTPPKKLEVRENVSAEHKAFVKEFYAKSFGLVHYLASDPTTTRQLATYLDLLAEGRSPNEAFVDAFQTTFAEFNKKFQAYLQNENIQPRALDRSKYAISSEQIQIMMEQLGERQAMQFLVARISSFPDGLLGKGNRKKLHASVEARYPGFFMANNNATSKASQDPAS